MIIGKFYGTTVSSDGSITRDGKLIAKLDIQKNNLKIFPHMLSSDISNTHSCIWPFYFGELGDKFILDSHPVDVFTHVGLDMDDIIVDYIILARSGSVEDTGCVYMAKFIRYLETNHDKINDFTGKFEEFYKLKFQTIKKIFNQKYCNALNIDYHRIGILYEVNNICSDTGNVSSHPIRKFISMTYNFDIYPGFQLTESSDDNTAGIHDIINMENDILTYSDIHGKQYSVTCTMPICPWKK